ncbi:complement factor H-related protein 2-like [Macrotis lagotis]|uniref:complement factor H-related protein 2-like n=1 Tax=Macrotis lagotis TaxID=92651 RepID=UPI003D682FE8
MDGHMDFPTCILIRPCGYPEIENGRIYKSFYSEEYHQSLFPISIGTKMYFHCNDNYIPTSGPSSAYWTPFSCTAEGWSPEPKCLREYHLPKIAHGYFRPTKDYYRQGDEITVECDYGYSLPNNQENIICTKQGWSTKPMCKSSCNCFHCLFVVEEGKCCELPPELLNGRPEDSSKEKYCHEDVVEYNCHLGFVRRGPKAIQCNDGEWTTLPTCIEVLGKCGPPPAINNGDITSFLLTQYAPESTVEYRCQRFYVLEGSPTVTCRNGNWTKEPKCLEACTISEEIMKKNNIELKWRNTEKIYTKTGEETEFTCSERFHPAPSSPPFRAKCVEGQISYPKCI